ncbi:MAG TPA: AMP-binding protein, partial [Kiloniellales bacterium]|nr:AMP-binding protein [Kiloniellales bacterium]
MGDVMNLGRLLSDTARRLPERAGLVCGERQWSWRQIDDRVNAVVAALKARGFGKGDKLLVQARNSSQFVEIMFSAFKLGAVWVPCNFRLTPPEVAHLAKSSDAAALFADDGFAGHVAAAREAAPALRTVFWIGAAPAGE